MTAVNQNGPYLNQFMSLNHYLEGEKEKRVTFDHLQYQTKSLLNHPALIDCDQAFYFLTEEMGLQEALSFFNTFLESHAEGCPDLKFEIDEAVVRAIKSFTNDLIDTAGEFAQITEEGSNRQTDRQVDLIGKQAGDLHAGFHINGSLWLPVGHMLCKLDAKEGLTIFNTGKGIEYHPRAKKVKQDPFTQDCPEQEYAQLYLHYTMRDKKPAAQVFTLDFFRAFIEPIFRSEWEAGYSIDPDYYYKGIKSYLNLQENLSVNIQSRPEAYKKIKTKQKNVLDSFFAAIYYKLAETNKAYIAQFEKIKLLWEIRLALAMAAKIDTMNYSCLLLFENRLANLSRSTLKNITAHNLLETLSITYRDIESKIEHYKTELRKNEQVPFLISEKSNELFLLKNAFSEKKFIHTENDGIKPIAYKEDPLVTRLIAPLFADPSKVLRKDTLANALEELILPLQTVHIEGSKDEFKKLEPKTKVLIDNLRDDYICRISHALAVPEKGEAMGHPDWEEAEQCIRHLETLLTFIENNEDPKLQIAKGVFHSIIYCLSKRISLLTPNKFSFTAIKEDTILLDYQSQKQFIRVSEYYDPGFRIERFKSPSALFLDVGMAEDQLKEWSSIGINPYDEANRAISFCIQYPESLADKYVQDHLWHHLFGPGKLLAQLEDAPSFAKTLAGFIAKSLELYLPKRAETKTCLFLAHLGWRLEAFTKAAGIPADFPNFRQVYHEIIESHKPDNALKLECYKSLIRYHSQKTDDELEGNKFKQIGVVEDLLLLTVFQALYNSETGEESEIYHARNRFEPFIEKQLETDEDQKNIILNLLIKAIGSKHNALVWDGIYPIYCADGFIINCETGEVRNNDRRFTMLPEFLLNHPDVKKAAPMIESCLAAGNRHYTVFPGAIDIRWEENWEITSERQKKCNYELEIQKMILNKEFYLVEPAKKIVERFSFLDNPEYRFWFSAGTNQDPPCFLVQEQDKDKYFATLFLEESEYHIVDIFSVEKDPLQYISFETIEPDLHFLRKIEKKSDQIETWLDINKEVIHSIRLRKWDISFKVVNRKAQCSKFPGYFLAYNQQEIPYFNSSIRLQNNLGEHLIIVPFSFENGKETFWLAYEEDDGDLIPKNRMADIYFQLNRLRYFDYPEFQGFLSQLKTYSSYNEFEKFCIREMIDHLHADDRPDARQLFLQMALSLVKAKPFSDLLKEIGPAFEKYIQERGNITISPLQAAEEVELIELIPGGKEKYLLRHKFLTQKKTRLGCKRISQQRASSAFHLAVTPKKLADMFYDSLELNMDLPEFLTDATGKIFFDHFYYFYNIAIAGPSNMRERLKNTLLIHSFMKNEECFALQNILRNALTFPKKFPSLKELQYARAEVLETKKKFLYWQKTYDSESKSDAKQGKELRQAKRQAKKKYMSLFHKIHKSCIDFPEKFTFSYKCRAFFRNCAEWVQELFKSKNYRLKPNKALHPIALNKNELTCTDLYLKQSLHDLIDPYLHLEKEEWQLRRPDELQGKIAEIVKSLKPAYKSQKAALVWFANTVLYEKQDNFIRDIYQIGYRKYLTWEELLKLFESSNYEAFERAVHLDKAKIQTLFNGIADYLVKQAHFGKLLQLPAMVEQLKEAGSRERWDAFFALVQSKCERDPKLSIPEDLLRITTAHEQVAQSEEPMAGGQKTEEKKAEARISEGEQAKVVHRERWKWRENIDLFKPGWEKPNYLFIVGKRIYHFVKPVFIKIGKFFESIGNFVVQKRHFYPILSLTLFARMSILFDIMVIGAITAVYLVGSLIKRAIEKIPKGACPHYRLNDVYKLHRVRKQAHPNLYVSNNYLVQKTSNMREDMQSPLSKDRKPLHSLLVIQDKLKDGKENIQAILLDDEESIFFRKKLRADRFTEQGEADKRGRKAALYDLGSGVVAQGKNQFGENELEGNAIFADLLSQARELRLME